MRGLLTIIIVFLAGGCGETDSANVTSSPVQDAGRRIFEGLVVFSHGSIKGFTDLVREKTTVAKTGDIDSESSDQKDTFTCSYSDRLSYMKILSDKELISNFELTGLLSYDLGFDKVTFENDRKAPVCEDQFKLYKAMTVAQNYSNFKVDGPEWYYVFNGAQGFTVTDFTQKDDLYSITGSFSANPLITLYQDVDKTKDPVEIFSYTGSILFEYVTGFDKDSSTFAIEMNTAQNGSLTQKIGDTDFTISVVGSKTDKLKWTASCKAYPVSGSVDFTYSASVNGEKKDLYQVTATAGSSCGSFYIVVRDLAGNSTSPRIAYEFMHKDFK